jgi:hypothetical protein
MLTTFLLVSPALALPSLFSSHVSQQAPIQVQEHSQGYKFDPLLHLPGTSPYFDAVGFGLKHKAPPGCNITAASYIVRHGAIYANDDGEYSNLYVKKVTLTAFKSTKSTSSRSSSS